MAESFSDRQIAYLAGAQSPGVRMSITDLQRWYLLATLALPLDTPLSMADIMRNSYGIKPIIPYPLTP